MDAAEISEDMDLDKDLRGASRMTGNNVLLMFIQSNQLIGGIIRGKATGNTFNMADLSPIKEHKLSFLMGKVKLYILSGNPELLDILAMRPTMVAEAPVSETIQPVLEALAENYSPVKGMQFH